MDNKKIIIFIIGLLLILIGLFGWNCFKTSTNLEEQTLEETEVYEDVQEVQTETEQMKEEVAEKKVKTEKQFSKPVKQKIQTRTLPAEVEQEEMAVLTETVVKDNQDEDPYVDSDGTVVVKNEFRPYVREKIPYKGVVYTIKTKLSESVKN